MKVFIGLSCILIGVVVLIALHIDKSNAIPHAVTPSETIIEQIKANQGYYRHDGRCFAYIVSTGYYGYKTISITQVNCTEDIK